MSSQRHKQGHPLGTGPGCFYSVRETVYIVIIFNQVRLIYNSAKTAADVVEVLRSSLGERKAVARNLRRKHSGENMCLFLRRYLPRQGFVQLQFQTQIRLSSQGLEYCIGKEPCGEWIWEELQVKNVVDNLQDWDWSTEPALDSDPSTAARRAYKYFGLPLSCTHLANATVRHKDGLEALLTTD